jgi:NADPH-ferrihemoprotein reductase
VHVLEDLESVKPKAGHLLELLPRLQARFYSISSSPRQHPSSIHITAVLVDYVTPTKRPVQGVCTGFLRSRVAADNVKEENNNEGNETQGNTVCCYVRRSQFRLPPKTETPLLMIGPGTGLAPFRGFLQERNQLRLEGRTLGEAILYFGCRKRTEDYLYGDELEEYANNGTLSKLRVAFSRDQAEKIYVTHLLRANKDEIWDVIGVKQGHLYVCGEAKNMAKQVKEIILETIMEKGNKTRTEAEVFFKRMESQQRYAADIWG